jgi:DNA polymerase-3 subunit epsilon
VADQLLAYVAGAEVIIHNAAFDVGFIERRASALAGRPGLREHAAMITDSLLMAREMFPGKANSLDALCRRLEVDNSNRTLHGALLDAGLLAEVYIRMTRGQDALAIDTAAAAAAAGIGNALAPIDLRGLGAGRGGAHRRRAGGPRVRAGRPGQGQRRQDGVEGSGIMRASRGWGG